MKYLTGGLLAVAAMWLGSVSAQEPSKAGHVHADDPAVVKLLDNLRGNEGKSLPPVKRAGAGDPKSGPVHRDYSNKMVYAPERQTALYAGGSHQTWRGNDVWEYHLGSNTWHQLFAPDGGNHAHRKFTLYFGALKGVRSAPDGKIDESKFSEKEKTELETTRAWWKANVVNQNGDVTTRRGGPIMNSHTWDGITYDPLVQRVLWASGGGAGGKPQYHAYLSGVPSSKVEADPAYTAMWMFDPAKKSWLHYKHSGPMAKLRGMGAALCYIPDLKQSIYYVAATNVTPQAFEMWTYDAVADQWAELKPNGGKAIRTLVMKEKAAPMAEQQVAYSAKHKKLVAVNGPDTFVYDIVKSEWSKVNSDERIDGHDAHTVFACDSASDVFLLANPKGKTKLAAFSLISTNKWEPLEWQGPPMPTGRYMNYMGYYDPAHNALILDGGNTMWAYRYRNQPAR